MLHATTMNRDGDPAKLSGDVDFGAFDDGAPSASGDGGSTEPAATDGGTRWP
jgi:glycerol-3-phosphate dehydrogenase